ncbi:hypothetical protein HOLleu_12025 [Holothuria leucospilota]|uniref:Uncharacterized protein n=1 Tax=Holothuria leucospilota TaxID=206669 RepID=A0A9Q1CAS6_HOLLE|nr:hypothetical protein HOLleu_12025 [Holothuria leucospilota]
MLRKHCCQFWMDFFAQLKHDGFFDGSELDKEIMRFCFLSTIQQELDRIRDEWNAHHIRYPRNVEGPYGRPVIMYNIPEVYNTRDYIFHVDQQETQLCKNEGTLHNDYPCDR